MEITQLRHFVAVAREMNFGRAAASLNITQPSLSRSIQKLEQSMGLNLFDRSRTHVRLTPAGAAFVEEARNALSQLDPAKSIARREDQGDPGAIRIGLPPRTYQPGYPRHIRAFKRQWRDVKLSFKVLPS